MGISVKWVDDEKQVMIWEFDERWTWDDLFKAQEDDRQLMNSVTHTVDIIGDLRNGSLLPANPHHLTQFRRLVQRRPPHAGVFVLIGANRLIKRLFQVYGQIHRGFDLVSFTEDYETAFNYLEKQRQKRN